MGGDLNDIKNREEKKGGKMRQETSFQNIRNFLADMEIGDIVYRGETFTGLTIDKGKVSFRKN